MSTESAYKASVTQASLEVLKRDFPDVAAQVQAAIPADLEAITRASRVDWIPAERHVAFHCATRIAFRDDVRYELFCRRATGRIAETPLVRPLLDAAVKILGATVESGLKWLPNVWASAARNMGRMVYEPGDDVVFGRLRLEGVPTFAMRMGTLPISIKGGYAAIYDVFRAQGTVELTRADEKNGLVVICFRR